MVGSNELISRKCEMIFEPVDYFLVELHDFIFKKTYIYPSSIFMKISLLLFFALFLLLPAFTRQAILVADCTVSYSIEGSNAATNSNLSGASKQVYVKGKMSRTDVSGQNYKQSIIYDKQTGSVTVLKEIGAEKYMSKLSKDEWKEENRRFDGLTITFTDETKTILSYECKKAVAVLKDGSSYSIFYSTAIKPSTSENPYQFKDIPGFVLEYETKGGKETSKITYTATSINFNPVSASRFEIPVSGYRILKN